MFLIRSLCLAILIACSMLAADTAHARQGENTCGNGRIDPGEECDDPRGNSDSRPDACRSDCRLARCGDQTIDTGEACDDGENSGQAYQFIAYNSDVIPGACRTSCQAPRCGDGVVDFPAGEQCDNGVNDGRNGCFQCRQCYGVFDGQVLAHGNARLCPGEYTLSDPGGDGVIRVAGDGVIVDCSGVVLRGAAPDTVRPQDVSPRPTVARPARPARPVSQPQPSAQEPSRLQAPAALQRLARPGSRAPGAGIVVTGRNATLIHCTVENFETGVRFEGAGNTLVSARLCGNGAAIASVAGNQGVRNTCSGPVSGWSETGNACAQACP
jgi:hypothetical protein